MSQELLRLSPIALFEGELKNAIANQTDIQFVDAITAGVTPITSSGSAATNVRADLLIALESIESGANSKFHVLMNSSAAKALTCMGDSSGQPFR